MKKYLFISLATAFITAFLTSCVSSPSEKAAAKYAGQYIMDDTLPVNGKLEVLATADNVCDMVFYIGGLPEPTHTVTGVYVDESNQGMLFSLNNSKAEVQGQLFEKSITVTVIINDTIPFLFQGNK